MSITVKNHKFEIMRQKQSHFCNFYRVDLDVNQFEITCEKLLELSCSK